MPYLNPPTYESQGITDWTGISCGPDDGPKTKLGPDGGTGKFTMRVPYARHQEIMRQLVGYSFHNNIFYYNFVNTLQRKLPEVYPYYYNFHGPLTSLPPQLQNNNTQAVVGGSWQQPISSAKGYPMHVLRANVIRHLTPITPERVNVLNPPLVGNAYQPDGGFCPTDYSFNPPWFTGTAPNTPIPWMPPQWFKETELEIECVNFPYRICFKQEVPQPVVQPGSVFAPEALRFTTVNVQPTERLLTGNLADWVFDPVVGSVQAFLPEGARTQVSQQIAIPEVSSIFTVNWVDVDPYAFNQLSLAVQGGWTNKYNFYVGVSGIDLTVKPAPRRPYWGFPPGSLLLLAYNPISTRSAFGDYYTYTVQMQFLYEPQGVNAALNPAIANANPTALPYQLIHRRGPNASFFDPTQAVRPFPAIDFNLLFLLNNPS